MCLFLHECLFLCWQQFNRRRKGWQNWHENSHLSWKNTYLWTLICSVLRIFWYTKLHSCWYHTKKNTNYLLHSKVFLWCRYIYFTNSNWAMAVSRLALDFSVPSEELRLRVPIYSALTDAPRTPNQWNGIYD